MPINTRLYATATQGEPEFAFGLLFDSDTMQPTIHAGDVVVCDGSVDAIDGDGLYCIREHGRVTIRRIRNNPYSGRIDLLFDNGRYGAIEGVEPGQVEVAGKVVWVISRP